MISKTSRATKIRWALILLSSVLLLLLSGFLLSSYIEQKIQHEINVRGGASTLIDVSLLKRSIHITDLKLLAVPDSTGTSRYSIGFHKASVEGVHLFELLIQRRLEVDIVAIEGGTVCYDKAMSSKHLKKDSTVSYPSIQIKQLSLIAIEVEVKTDATTVVTANVNAQITDFFLPINSFQLLLPKAAEVKMTLLHVAIQDRQGMYSGKVARFFCDTQKQYVRIDSIELVPNYGRYEFAHRLGKQTDRVTLLVSTMTVEGLQFSELLDSSLKASKVRIDSFEVVAFRDKRVADLDEQIVRLPMATFLKFPWKVNIDSVLIYHSRVVVEEVPEKGNTSSLITFEDINALLTGWNNVVHEENQKHALLHATGKLMGEGTINAWFTLPLDGNEMYNAYGSVRKMSFAKLNPALEPLANIRIETGYLNELTFNFNYNDLISKGSLELDYRDLHLISLGKDHHSKNGLRTLLLNAIVKNDRNKSMSSAKRIGEIDILCDRRRFIFNIWWNSIRGGLRSIVLRTGKKDHAPVISVPSKMEATK